MSGTDVATKASDSASSDAASQKPKMDRHQFYFETPLYEVVSLANVAEDLFEGVVDAYSAENKWETTYDIKADEYWRNWGGFGMVTLKCRRSENDVLRFYVLTNKEAKLCTKVGQWPALVDLQFAEMGKKYDKHMDKQDLQEFKRAIGLAAHGVGVGSFVYLRRIFENLIRETYEEYKKQLPVTEEEFRGKRMDEKVELLKDHLPSQLVKMKSMYGVLSLGIHELNEDDCRAYFSVVKMAIDLILEQKIESDSKAQRDKDVAKQLAALEAELKSHKKSQ